MPTKGIFICLKMYIILVFSLQVEELIEEFNSRGKYVAAMIVEPIQAEGGQYTSYGPNVAYAMDLSILLYICNCWLLFNILLEI